MKWLEFALCEIEHDSPQVMSLKVLQGANESLVIFSLSLFLCCLFVFFLLFKFEFLLENKVFGAVLQTEDHSLRTCLWIAGNKLSK